MAEFRSGLLGRLKPDSSRVAVVGAGVSGLLTGHFFKRQGYEVEIFEASSRAGGLIQTTRTPFGIVEHAAHSFLLTPSFAKLARELELPILRVNPAHKSRYIVRDQQLRKFPLTAAEFMRAAGGMMIPMPHARGLSLRDWADTRLGKAARTYLVEPGVAGVFAGDLSAMSLESVSPFLAELETKALVQVMLAKSQARRAGKNARSSHSSRSRGMFVFRDGTQALTDALTKNLKQELRLGEQITHLADLRDAGNVVLCTDAAQSAALLRTIGVSNALCQELSQTQYLPMVAAGVFVRRSDLPGFREGVGALIPKCEGFRINGILFNSSAFENRSTAPDVISLTCMLGGALDRDVVTLSDEELDNLIASELKRLFGFNGNFLHKTISRWPRALPHYTRELVSLWPRLNAAVSEQAQGVLLLSNYTGQISVRGIVESLDRAV